MSNKNVTLKEKVNGVLGDTIFPATTTPNVYDSAKSQALSQTLVNTPDYEALGFAKFSTATAYNAGDKVYKDNELYRFIADKTAGEWDVAKVEPWSIEQEIEEVDDAIRSLIPAQASEDNKLADKEYVNDKVSTDTATFRGTFNLITDLELTTEATQGQIATALGTAISGEDKNDYTFVQIPTSDATPTEIARIDRYKYTGLQWAFEYSLNNSGFTAEQWAAINSGITSSLVTAFGAKYDKPAGGIPKTDLSEGVQTSLNKADTALQQSDGDERYLRLGSYSASTAVGLADNLRGQTVDSEAYLIRPTGGVENEVANGVASVLGMEGNSCVWNQNIPVIQSTWSKNNVSLATNSMSYTFSNNVIGTSNLFCGLPAAYQILNTHKYYIAAYLEIENNTGNADFGVAFGGSSISSGKIVSSRGKESGYRSSVSSPQVNNQDSRIYIHYSSADASNITEGTKVTVSNVVVIDLTLLGIDNLTTADQVKEWLAQHVGTKPYYAYNAGTILSAQTLGVKTYGQNLLNPTTRQAKLIPYTWEDNSNIYTIKNVPSGATATFTPDATGVAETVDISGGSLDITYYGCGIVELSSATADTYVCMKWDEQKDDDVVPYEDHTYDFDVRKVYGKVGGAGEYVQCYPNDMRSAGSVHDTLIASEAVVKTHKVDLSTMTIETRYTGSVNKTISLNLPYGYNKSSVAILSQTYKYIGGVSGVISNPDNKEVGLYTYNGGTPGTSYILYIVMPVGSSLTNNDVIIYSRSIPTTYTDLIYRDGGIDTPLADVLMNIEVNNWSMEEQLMTPYVDGNPTSIPATIKTQYGMDAVEAIDTLQKTCYFADDVKANLQALLTCINTNCSETLGGTFSIGDPDEDSKVFTFTFTANTEPDVEPTNEGE